MNLINNIQIIIQLNSIQFFIIYVPSQQLQDQLQTQHSIGTKIIIVRQYNNNNSIQFFIINIIQIIEHFRSRVISVGIAAD
jgi:hypothetical protein